MHDPVRPAPATSFPPTLKHAIAALSADAKRGFVFVRADGSERFCSFQEIHAETARRGARLARRGLEKGDRIALVIPDGDEFVLSFLAAIVAGIVPVPMYPQLSFRNVEGYHDTVAHIVRASGAKALLTTGATRPFVEPVLGKVENLHAVMTVDELAGDPDLPPVERAIAPEDMAFLQFTSGSTSRPKGVMVTHANLAANSEAFMIHGLGKDSSFDKGVSWLPLYHDMGLIGFVIGPLFTDIPVVFLPTASFVRSPRVWLDAIHRHRGTITYAPNFAYALVAKRLKDKDVAGLDLSCMRITGCGAEPIQAKTLRDFAAKLEPAGFASSSLIPSYGMAEATLAITFARRGHGMRVDRVESSGIQAQEARPVEPDASAEGTQEIVSCGFPFPGHEIAIEDEQGQRLADRRIGHILARGPSTTAGYYKEPELTSESYKDGWLRTGDLGYLADGELFVCGRLKDIIIIRGRNFYPQDIEWVVSELPGVRRGNVVAFSVEVDGEEQLVICAEAFQSEAAGLVEAIGAAVSAQLGLTAHRVEVLPQGTLPRTSSGKPQRRKTKALLLEGSLKSGAAIPRGGEGAESVRGGTGLA